MADERRGNGGDGVGPDVGLLRRVAVAVVVARKGRPHPQLHPPRTQLLIRVLSPIPSSATNKPKKQRNKEEQEEKACTFINPQMSAPTYGMPKMFIITMPTMDCLIASHVESLSPSQCPPILPVPSTVTKAPVRESDLLPPERE